MTFLKIKQTLSSNQEYNSHQPRTIFQNNRSLKPRGERVNNCSQSGFSLPSYFVKRTDTNNTRIEPRVHFVQCEASGGSVHSILGNVPQDRV